ncbi:MAG: (deoxy)nucleoside triphosphate pyrophosphohydrolase [Clostridia bacterium]|nr:(deoxy)nucleoside triphosphate pyrophosphohydrolase [Clostridia bacterium]
MQKTKRAIEVVAALIVRGDRFLACQRPPEKARGLLWEFVGGKVEAGESGPEALVRECREELDVVLSVGEAIMDVTHAYPDLTVHLTLYRSRIAQGEPKLIEHHDFRWITAEEIGDYEFCPADQAFLEEIRRKGLA